MRRTQNALFLAGLLFGSLSLVPAAQAEDDAADTVPPPPQVQQQAPADAQPQQGDTTDSSGQPPRVGYAPTVAAALAGVGIDPSSVTQIPGAESAPVVQPGTQPQQGQTPTPPPADGQSAVPPSPQRDAIVKRMDDALTAMQQALSAGNFTAYGQAQTDLQAAVRDYENLPTG